MSATRLGSMCTEIPWDRSCALAAEVKRLTTAMTTATTTVCRFMKRPSSSKRFDGIVAPESLLMYRPQSGSNPELGYVRVGGDWTAIATCGPNGLEPGHNH